jgi:zinc transport system substrate-binding protein
MIQAKKSSPPKPAKVDLEGIGFANQIKYFIKVFGLINIVFGMLLFVGCQKQDVQNSKPKVFVSILPQKYFVDKICGNLMDVSVMVLPGSSPHTYEPRPSQMKELSKAMAYFSIGVEFENVWLPKFSALSQGLKIIHTDSSVEKLPLDSAELVEMRRAKGAKAGHGPGLDPHIWLSPKLVKQIARNTLEGLCAIDPAHEAIFRQNLRLLDLEISGFQDTLRVLFKCDSVKTRQKAFMVFHPSWAYFAREFGLRQLAIEIEGKEPSAKQLEQIYSVARENHIHTLFVQPQFSRQSAQAMAHELNAQVLVADDLAYNWPENMLLVSRAIAAQ